MGLCAAQNLHAFRFIWNISQIIHENSLKPCPAPTTILGACMAMLPTGNQSGQLFIFPRWTSFGALPNFSHRLVQMYMTTLTLTLFYTSYKTSIFKVQDRYPPPKKKINKTHLLYSISMRPEQESREHINLLNGKHVSLKFNERTVFTSLCSDGTVPAAWAIGANRFWVLTKGQILSSSPGMSHLIV